MTEQPSIPLLSGIAPLAAGAEAWISDIWGVLHNGVTAFPAASEACVRYRQGGGRVVLVTNAPQPKAGVAHRLAELGVPAAAYDHIVTSGDVTQRLIQPYAGRSVLHLGPPGISVSSMVSRGSPAPKWRRRLARWCAPGSSMTTTRHRPIMWPDCGPTVRSICR